MTDIVTAPDTEPHPDARGGAPAPSAPGTAGTVADPATAGVPRPGSLPTPSQAQAAAKDRTLTSPAAVELAHSALGAITEPLSVGAHAGARSEVERVVTHLFECNLAGYRGWRWAATLTRPPRSRTATVCELELLPGEDAILAPAWVPWADRLEPGDVARSDRLPRRETDERLEPGWEATGEQEGDAVGTDAVDFGRPRVLSPAGMRRAAQRWYEGDHGPQADGVRSAHARCSGCGFFVPLAGPLRRIFGICANEWAADDGRVVSLDHGCGAHSETDLPDQGPEWPVTPSRLDELAMEPLATNGASLRDGESLAEAVAKYAAEHAPRRSGDGPGQSKTAGQAGARGGAPAGSPPEAEQIAPDGEAADGRASTPARPTGGEPDATGAAGRADATAGEDDVVDSEQPCGGGADEPASPREPGGGSSRRRRKRKGAPEDGAVQDRHAAALEAVADLTADLGAPAQTTPIPSVPASLAELEAHMPTRG